MAQFQEKIMNIELKNCIYEHTDSGPDGLVEHTFPDSVVPFDLKGLLDAKILQFLKLVEELVDRILTFYMITDPSIGCRDQSPPPREIALKNYLKTPPVGNENQMAQWMNRIGELIEKMHPQVHKYVPVGFPPRSLHSPTYSNWTPSFPVGLLGIRPNSDCKICQPNWHEMAGSEQFLSESSLTQSDQSFIGLSEIPRNFR